jgi:hypothetical protein
MKGENMNRWPWLVILIGLIACGRGDSNDRGQAGGSTPRADDSQRVIGPLPMDTVMAALKDYDERRISVDSAATIISNYMQRTGRVLNLEMAPELRAAIQRQNAH